MNMVWRDDGGYLFTVGGPAQSNITTGSTNDGVRVWNYAGTRTAGNLIAFGDGGASPGAIVVSRGQRSVPSDYAAGPLVEGSVGNVDAAASAASCRGCGALAAPCSEGCQVHRRAAEAPLVALVNAVPEGLDPVGWRAAVLCCHEGGLLKGCDFAGVRESLAWFLRQPRDGRVPDSVKAYDRAIAPQGQRPAPFRRGAPGLPVDDGRDA